MVLGIFWSEARVWLWTPALAFAGAACLVNAARCGRRHCFFTGPLYLAAAGVVAGSALDFIPLQAGWILAGLIFGILAAYAPEWVRGKYV